MPKIKALVMTDTPYLQRIWVFLAMATALFVLLNDESGRLYWPYMISAYLLGVLVYMYESSRKPGIPKSGLLAYLFPREVWMHPSALRDYITATANFFLLSVMVGFFVTCNKYVILVFYNLTKILSFEQTLDSPTILVIALYTFFSLVFNDLFYYIAHRMFHKIPFLWEYHKVHHSAEVMTPVTVLRTHPVELITIRLFRILGLGLVAGVFFYLYPNMEGAITIVGVNAGIFFFNVFGANLRHSHIWLSFGEKIEHVLISPAQHQIHHSTKPEHFDKNFGSAFAVWDWMFGSLYIPKGREEISFGIGSDHEQEDMNSLLKMYLNPVKKSVQCLKAKKS